MKKISGNKLLVKALKEEGVDILFGYPGACTIDISDEIYKQDYTKVVLPRHEQALVHAADAYARSTGKVGVCLVTSGPGATNLVTGIATANYDSVPLVCFTGQVARHLIGNDAFQEVDIVGITRSITKYGVTVRKREDLGRIIKEAFYIARSGRPGPVLVDLPKDVMAELGSPNYPETVNIRGYKPSTGVHIGQLKRAVKMLGKAKKPLFLAGGGVNIAGANKAFTELVERTQIPVVTTIMGRGAIPTTHPLFIGNLGMHGAYASNMAVEECDLLFSIGTRFNDRITGKLHAFAPKATIVHIDIDTSSISRNIQVDIPIVADAKEAIEKLLLDIVAQQHCHGRAYGLGLRLKVERGPALAALRADLVPHRVASQVPRHGEADAYLAVPHIRVGQAVDDARVHLQRVSVPLRQELVGEAHHGQPLLPAVAAVVLRADVGHVHRLAVLVDERLQLFGLPYADGLVERQCDFLGRMVYGTLHAHVALRRHEPALLRLCGARPCRQRGGQ